jgi:hypothetical protein
LSKGIYFKKSLIEKLNAKVAALSPNMKGFALYTSEFG